MNTDDIQALQDFLHQNGQTSQAIQQPFTMEQMRRDLEGYRTRSPQTGSPMWTSESDPQEQTRLSAAFQGPKTDSFVSAGFSPVDFQLFQQLESNGQARNSTPLSHKSFSMHGYQRPMGIGYGSGMPISSYRPMVHQRPSQTVEARKGKERVVELDEKDWEQQFAQMDEAQQKDLDAEANAAIEAELNDIDRSVFSETNELGDFEGIWRGIEAETESARQMLDDERIHMNDGLPLRDYDTWEGFDSQFRSPFRDPQLGNYVFETENVFSTSKDPFGIGMKILQDGGNLSLASLAFEAAVQQDPQHTEAWVQLGSAQAQNEKETPAIRALEQALKLDPSNLEALMGLAISYTNDGWDSTAYRTLERWLATKYPQIISLDNLTPEADMGFTDRHLLHEKVTDLFIRAAQLSPDGEHMDPDVQVGLGVLFYGQEEYSKAVDCFQAALASTESGFSNHRAQAHLLWNRLGATLANSGRSEDATDAYEQALTLRPNFVRARYNLGVSCINMELWTEAAQHLLGAMSMHRVVEQVGLDKVREVVDAGAGLDGLGEADLESMVGGNESTNLLETLRRVFGNMGRKDLADRVGRGMDVDSFRGEFDF